MKLHIDPDLMTIGDLEDFEEITGKQFDKVLAGTIVKDEETGQVVKDEKGRPVREVSMRAVDLKALVYITGRQSNPAFTLEDARNVRVTELSLEGDEGDEGKGESGTSA